MIVKTLLAWVGLRAAPTFHDMRVHDAMNVDAAIVSSVRIVARQSRAVANAIVADPGNVGGIGQGVDRMRDTVEELIRRTR